MGDPHEAKGAREVSESTDRRFSPSEAWAQHFRRGDPEAVKEARKRVAKILRHRGLAIADQEREDLEQEVMTEIWQAINRSRFNMAGGFWGFVEVVTTRRSIDWLRARRERQALSTEMKSPSQGALERALERERAGLAREILAALDRGCRWLLQARLRDGTSYAELARSTGKTEGALRVQVYRCIRRARKLWKHMEEEAGYESR